MVVDEGKTRGRAGNATSGTRDDDLISHLTRVLLPSPSPSLSECLAPTMICSTPDAPSHFRATLASV